MRVIQMKKMIPEVRVFFEDGDGPDLQELLLEYLQTLCQKQARTPHEEGLSAPADETDPCAG